MTRILLGWQKAREQLGWIRTLVPGDCELLVPEPSPDQGEYDADPDELMRLGAEADVIVGWNFPADVLRSAKKLKLVSSAHTGVDRYDLDLFRERGVMLCNASGVNAVAVAEHAMALLLACAKRVVDHDASVRRVDWVDLGPATAGMSLAGKTAAIVGLGRIGKLVAARCRAFDMSVVGVKRDVSGRHPEVDEVFPARHLDRALARAHAVILTLPLTAATRGLMDPGSSRRSRRGNRRERRPGHGGERVRRPRSVDGRAPRRIRDRRVVGLRRRIAGRLPLQRPLPAARSSAPPGRRHAGRGVQRR